jgi:hypothetical protein
MNSTLNKILGADPFTAKSLLRHALKKSFPYITFIILINILTDPVWGQMYLVKGTFSYKLNIYGEKEQPSPSLRTFEALCNGDAWRISVHVSDDKQFDSYIYSYDGTNLFYTSIPFSPKVPGSVPGAVIESTPVPQRITYGLGEYIWLAYLSGNYFRTVSNGMAVSFEPIRSNTGFIKRYEVPCKFELAAEAPFLPTNAQYRTTQLITLNDSGDITTFPLHSPYQSGFVRMNYESHEFTNIGKYFLPLTFEAHEYRMFPAAKSASELFCSVEIQGSATSMSVDNLAWVNDINGKIYVAQDLRVPEPQVVYPITHGVIPSLNSTDVMNATREASIRQGVKAIPTSSDMKKDRFVFVLIFVVISLVPLVFFVRKRGGKG